VRWTSIPRTSTCRNRSSVSFRRKVRRYSDSLLHSLLKAHLPEFADKQIVQNVQDDQGFGDLSDLTPDELEQLQSFLEKVKERKEGGGSETDVP